MVRAPERGISSQFALSQVNLLSHYYLQLLKNAKTLKTDKSVELNTSKITQLETELKDALAKLKDLENTKEEKSEKKVRFGELTKKDSDVLKLKQEELDKLKLNLNKVSK